MPSYAYEIWRSRLDVLSEWDGGGGEVVATEYTYQEAEKAVADYQSGGDAAWFVRIEV